MKKHSIALLGLTLLTLVLVTAMVVAAQTPLKPAISQATQAKHVDADTARALDSVFENLDYPWPPGNGKEVPPVVLKKLPTDFGKALPPNKRRELFLRALLPIVLIENQRLREQRELARWLLEEDKLPAEGSPMRDWLEKTARQLRVRGDLNDPAVRKKILMRLDEIPPALALAQAAIETGWGSSRFALEGNSLFGQWTFTKGDGLAPNQRDADATHLVASFPDLRASVRAYMRNLNTSNAYHEFRTYRAKARATGQPLRAYELASHLHRYSARGENYIAEIQRIIRSPSIAALAKASLGSHTLAAKADDTAPGASDG
ncbi:MAG TPA: flagellar biosynthesis protein FlgJ [Gammaproteobacteria bacterium]|nr:flagellar biosynthesis protein FlgJ [Gammaproteobacteria bacterium]